MILRELLIVSVMVIGLAIVAVMVIGLAIVAVMTWDLEPVEQPDTTLAASVESEENTLVFTDEADKLTIVDETDEMVIMDAVIRLIWKHKTELEDQGFEVNGAEDGIWIMNKEPIQ